MNIYIVRHGNTFLSNELPRRVGVKTNLPLVASGIKQANDLGSYFSQQKIVFDAAFCSNLIRTSETAKIILSYQSDDLQIIPHHLFDEIDHGIDENKPEEEVVNRIGQNSIENWDKYAIPPDGWIVNFNERVEGWRIFFEQNKYKKNVLVVTSNGSARFALLSLKQKVNLSDYKLRTGSFGVLKKNALNEFEIASWNQRPV